MPGSRVPDQLYRPHRNSLFTQKVVATSLEVWLGFNYWKLRRALVFFVQEPSTLNSETVLSARGSFGLWISGDEVTVIHNVLCFAKNGSSLYVH